MFGNLRDDPQKWANGRVHVGNSKYGEVAQVMIEDDGLVIPKNRAEEVMARGTGFDMTVPGAGIRLPIVQELAALHGGSVTLGQSRGVRITVRLPGADKPPDQILGYPERKQIPIVRPAAMCCSRSLRRAQIRLPLFALAASP